MRLVLAIAGVGALAATGATGASAVVPSASLKVSPKKPDGGSAGKREKYETIWYDCEDGARVATQPTDGTYLEYDGPTNLWPPNHKYRDYTIRAVDSDGGEVSLMTVANHDEYVEDGTEMNGSGNTDDDFVDTTPVDADSGAGEAINTGRIRGERSGRGDGREYTFDATAMFDDGECMHRFTAFVPHDQGKGNGSRKKGKRARR